MLSKYLIPTKITSFSRFLKVQFNRSFQEAVFIQTYSNWRLRHFISLANTGGEVELTYFKSRHILILELKT